MYTNEKEALAFGYVTGILSFSEDVDDRAEIKLTNANQLNDNTVRVHAEYTAGEKPVNGEMEAVKKSDWFDVDINKFYWDGQTEKINKWLSSLDFDEDYATNESMTKGCDAYHNN